MTWPGAVADQPGPTLWTPPAEARQSTEIGRYLTWLERERGRTFPGYDELWAWSVEDLEGFWASIWDYFQIRAHAPYDRVLGSRAMPGARWFEGAVLVQRAGPWRWRGSATAAQGVRTNRPMVPSFMRGRSPDSSVAWASAAASKPNTRPTLTEIAPYRKREVDLRAPPTGPQIGIHRVDRHRLHPDHHLSRRRHRVRQLHVANLFRTAQGVDARGLHGCLDSFELMG